MNIWIIDVARPTHDRDFFAEEFIFFELRVLYSRNTNPIGNIIKDNDERNTLLYKNISLNLFSKRGPQFVVGLRNRWRDIYSDRGLLFICSSWSQRVPRLALLCKLVRDDLISCVFLARLRFSELCLNLTAWFSSRDLLSVTHLLYSTALIVLSYLCLLITTWQLSNQTGSLETNQKSMSYVI